MPPIGHTMLWSVLPHRAHRPDPVGRLRVEDGGEARDAALHDLFVHDIGLVDARLRPCPARLLIFTVTAGRLNDAPDLSGKPGERRDLAPLRGRRGARPRVAASSSSWPCRTCRRPHAVASTASATSTAMNFVTAPSEIHRLSILPVVNRLSHIACVTSPGGRGSGRRAADACRTSGSAACCPCSTILSSGSSIQRCAVAFDAVWIDVSSAFSFSSAEISPGGYRVSCAPDASARYSRWRLTANCMT